MKDSLNLKIFALNFHHVVTKDEVRAEPWTNCIITRHDTDTRRVRVLLKNRRHPTA